MIATVEGKCLAVYEDGKYKVALLKQFSGQPISVFNADCVEGENVSLVCRISIRTGYGQQPALNIFCVEE